MKRIFSAIIFLIIHPVSASKYYNEKIIRVVKFRMRSGKARKLGIVFAKPNYAFKNVFDSSSVIVNVGCADEPDFSLYMMKQYNVRAFAVDPTRRYSAALKAIETALKVDLLICRLRLVPLMVSLSLWRVLSRVVRFAAIIRM
jgi:hypothetical protein